MKVTVSESKGLKTNLNVLVKKQEIDKKIEERVIELQKTVNIKGFRPGKAPVDLLKKQFAQALYGEVLEKILQDNTYQALNENKIKEEQRSSSGNIINTTTFTFDDKNCPTKNILGFKYLNGWYDDNSPNNNILVRTESNSPSSKQTYTYQYNDKGFPISVIHTVGGFTDNGQFFY